MDWKDENSRFAKNKGKRPQRQRPPPKRMEAYMPYQYAAFTAIREILLQSDKLLTRQEIIDALPGTEAKTINATLLWGVANNEFSQDRFFQPPRYGASSYTPPMTEAADRAVGVSDYTRKKRLPNSAIQRIVKELVNMPETTKKRSTAAAIRQLLMDSQRHLRKRIEDQLERMGYTRVQASSNVAAGIGSGMLEADPEREYIWLSDKGRRQLLRDQGDINPSLTPATERMQKHLGWEHTLTPQSEPTLEERLERIEDIAMAETASPARPLTTEEFEAQAETEQDYLDQSLELPRGVRGSYVAKRRIGMGHEDAKSAALRGASFAELERDQPRRELPETVQETVPAPIQAYVQPLAEEAQQRPPGDAYGAGEPKQERPATVRDKADRALVETANKLTAERLDKLDARVAEVRAMIERVEALGFAPAPDTSGVRFLPEDADAYMSWDDKLVLRVGPNEVLHFSNDQTLKLAMMLHKLLK